MKTVCIMCPVGCKLEIVKNKSDISVTGNACIRGEQYGKSEIINPVRVVTSVVKGGEYVASVKTTCAIPKTKIFDVLNELRKIKKDNFFIGEILIYNVAKTKANIVVTGLTKI